MAKYENVYAIVGPDKNIARIEGLRIFDREYTLPAIFLIEADARELLHAAQGNGKLFGYHIVETSGELRSLT